MAVRALVVCSSPPRAGARSRAFAGAWGLVGAGVWAVYLVGYEKPEGTPPVTHVLNHPADGAGYFLTSLGSSLFWGRALGAGVLLVCLAALVLFAVFKDGRARENSFWISLLLSSLLSMALVTVGRSGFGKSRPSRRPWHRGSRRSPSRGSWPSTR